MNYPNISDAELARIFTAVAHSKLQQALNGGVSCNVFEKHYNGRHILYTINPNCLPCDIFNFLTIQKKIKKKHKKKKKNLGKTPENNKNETNIKDVTKTQRKHKNQRKSSINVGSIPSVSYPNRQIKRESQTQRIKSITDAEKLRKDLILLRNDRRRMKLNGVDRGALK